MDKTIMVVDNKGIYTYSGCAIHGDRLCYSERSEESLPVRSDSRINKT